MTLPRLLLSSVLRTRLLFPARTSLATVERCLCPHGAQQQTRRTTLLRSNDGTGRRTSDRYLDRAPHPYAGSVTVPIKRVSNIVF